MRPTGKAIICSLWRIRTHISRLKTEKIVCILNHTWIFKDEICRICNGHIPKNVIRMNLNAFEYFGDFTDTILYDNMKQVVPERKLKA